MKGRIIATILILSIIAILLYDNNYRKILSKVINLNARWKFNKIEEFDSKAEFPEDAEKATYTRNGFIYLVDDAKNNMQYGTIDLLDLAREDLEEHWNKKSPALAIVFDYNSARRTLIHNKREGSFPTSAHVKGFAVDIAWRSYNLAQKEEILRVLYKVGFRRFGIGKGFVHADNDPSHPQNVVWNYGNSAYQLSNIEIDYIENLAA